MSLFHFRFLKLVPQTLTLFQSMNQTCSRYEVPVSNPIASSTHKMKHNCNPRSAGRRHQREVTKLGTKSSGRKLAGCHSSLLICGTSAASRVKERRGRHKIDDDSLAFGRRSRIGYPPTALSLHLIRPLRPDSSAAWFGEKYGSECMVAMIPSFLAK